ncbi:receptor expression-enhancing protein 1-like [Planoprotostelium fungivorum]|uniref:Receptor expression-enhancing protein 1-like n=1 Tax=Planoprotostelium fungivorum TaxID=1890364 RepID=A0A2P6NHF0_9EUKA|nr:receptor expression-enhancing protein 1-like [Planoprotostelium fungivorum]
MEKENAGQFGPFQRNNNTTHHDQHGKMLGYFVSKNICIIILYLAPAYQTWKSLKSNLLSNYDPFNSSGMNIPPMQFYKELEEQKRLLHYWIVVGLLSIIEFYIDVLVFAIPFYYEIKIVFLAWLTYSKGAEILFGAYIDPTLETHEKAIDDNIEEFKVNTFWKICDWGNALLSLTWDVLIKAYQRGTHKPVANGLRSRSVRYADNPERRSKRISRTIDQTDHLSNEEMRSKRRSQRLTSLSEESMDISSQVTAGGRKEE